MEFKDFEDFLSHKFMEDQPQVLDDDLPDAFDNWVTELDVESIIKWADEYKEAK